MKITLNKTETTGVEIDLPYYSKDGCHFYKVFSENSCVAICEMTHCDRHEIIIAHAGLAFNGYPEKTESSEQEFNEAFVRVTNKIMTAGNINQSPFEELEATL